MSNVKYVQGLLPGIPGERPIAVLEGDTHIGRWVEESHRLDHDQSTLPAIARLKMAQGGVIWDVGAYIGDHTCAYACMAKKVLAFEARPDAYACLRENTRHYPHVTALPLALGDGTPASADLSHEANGGARRLVPGSGTPTVTLDQVASTIVRDSWRPTLIKLDVEGWEVKVLHGAWSLIQQNRPTFVIEVNKGALKAVGDEPNDLWWRLIQQNYAAVDLFTKVIWDPFDDVEQRDIVAWPLEQGLPW